MTKYHNIPTAIDGIRFDSRKEANRFYQLRLLERAGEISNLRRQVEYELIPAQKTPAGRAVRPVKYVADFVYDDHGKMVVGDVTCHAYMSRNGEPMACMDLKANAVKFLGAPATDYDDLPL